VVLKVIGTMVVITEETGSFSSKLVRHSLSKGVGEIRIFSGNESNQDAMHHSQTQDLDSSLVILELEC
jgi:UDP-glucose 4-epimerase